MREDIAIKEALNFSKASSYFSFFFVFQLYLFYNKMLAYLLRRAAEVFLTSPAVSARIERLEAEGILTGFHASVDPIQLGYHIKAYISLEISPAQKPEVYPFLRAHPNVLECDCVTGNYSVLLKVAFPSTMELDEFIGKLQNFGKTSTMIVFSTIVENRGVVPE